jgi:hypothetical protein
MKLYATGRPTSPNRTMKTGKLRSNPVPNKAKKRAPYIIDRASVLLQWLLWKFGISWHNTLRDECTPNFSCCINKFPVGSWERFILGHITESAKRHEAIVRFDHGEH